jgi:hypothetical protein
MPKGKKILEAALKRIFNIARHGDLDEQAISDQNLILAGAADDRNHFGGR